MAARQQANPTGSLFERTRAFSKKVPDLLDYYAATLRTIALETSFASSTLNNLTLSLSRSPTPNARRYGSSRHCTPTPDNGARHRSPKLTGSAAHMTGGEKNAKLSVGSVRLGLKGKRRLANFLSYPLERGIMRRSPLTLGGKKERWSCAWCGRGEGTRASPSKLRRGGSDRWRQHQHVRPDDETWRLGAKRLECSGRTQAGVTSVG